MTPASGHEPTGDATAPVGGEPGATSAGADIGLDATSPAQDPDGSDDDGVDAERRAALARVRLQAIGIVAAALTLVAAAAVVLHQRGDDRGEFGTLQAPVTADDVRRADLARSLRDAATAVAEGSVDTRLGGFRDSGRGWVFGNERNDGDSSLFDSLRPELDDDVDELIAALDADDGVLIHGCGDHFAVFVRSSAPVADEDRSWWEDNDCSDVPFWLVGDPEFFAVGVADDR